jgi:hypothetical protein
LSTFERGLHIDQMAAKTAGAVHRADVPIFVKSMIYIRRQLLTSFWDAKGITFTVKNDSAER